MNKSSINRLKLMGFNSKQKKIEQRVETTLGKDDMRITKKLGDLYERLPHLSMHRDAAIAIFEEQTQRASRILQFPIVPTIIEHEGRLVWNIDNLANFT